MPDFPASLVEFQRQFPDDDTCAAWLVAARWPSGFRCPACAGAKGWPHGGKPFTFECAACGKQTSATAGTIMHGSKLPLIAWFWAAYLMATHSNGISGAAIAKATRARFLQVRVAAVRQAAPRHGRAGPRAARWPCRGRRSQIPLRTKTDPVCGGGGRSPQGKMLVAGAVEVENDAPGRLRLAAIQDFSAASLHGFVAANVAPGATIKTDGWPSYARAPDVRHEPHVVGAMAAHVVLPWVHRAFSNAKTWALGVYHGLRRQHLQSYLDEFAFRFNRRRTRHAAFRSLLAIALVRKPLTYNMLIMPEAQG